MSEYLLSHEAVVRFGFFFGILAVMAIWELRSPRRSLAANKTQRWIANLGIVVVDSVVVRLLVPLLPVTLAIVCAERGWGIMNITQLPAWQEFLLSIVVLDLIVYLQHVMFHSIPALWRLHMVHHSDVDLDVTSGNRFHPLEILISIGIKLCAVMLIGPSAAAVIVFEIILNGMAQFNHSNVKIPARIDAILRRMVVTPDMHKVHHSVDYAEANSNFGFNLPWWDRLFGTYRPEPQAGVEKMTIGLSQFRQAEKLSLPRLMLLPITGDVGRYALNARKTGNETAM